MPHHFITSDGETIKNVTELKHDVSAATISGAKNGRYPKKVATLHPAVHSITPFRFSNVGWRKQILHGKLTNGTGIAIRRHPIFFDSSVRPVRNDNPNGRFDSKNHVR
jgi:hypothetical protein